MFMVYMDDISGLVTVAMETMADGLDSRRGWSCYLMTSYILIIFVDSLDKRGRQFKLGHLASFPKFPKIKPPNFAPKKLPNQI